MESDIIQAIAVGFILMADALRSHGMFDLAIPFTVAAFADSSANAGSGLEPGDVIVRAGGVDTPYVQDVKAVFAASPASCVTVDFVRGADTLSTSLRVDASGLVGIYLQAPEYGHRTYSLASSIPAGAAMAWDNIKGYAMDLRLVATPSTGAYKSVGSFISIGQIFPSTWSWYQFLYILGMLSIMLGVMNLLPIPALDGGHMVFCLYEMISGRKPSDRFLTVMQMIGMILLMALMFLAFGNDFAKLFGI